VHDEMKRISDDAFYTNEHVTFLLDKFRSALLKKEYVNLNKRVDEDDYQSIDLTFSKSGKYLVSNEEVPTMFLFASPRVFVTGDIFGEHTICYVAPDRMPYLGHSTYRKNILYASVIDNKLYIKSDNPMVEHLESFTIRAVFTDSVKAYGDDLDTVIEKKFPLEAHLIEPCIMLCVKELTMGANLNSDDINNSADSGPDIQKGISGKAREAINDVPSNAN